MTDASTPSLNLRALTAACALAIGLPSCAAPERAGPPPLPPEPPEEAPDPTFGAEAEAPRTEHAEATPEAAPAEAAVEERYVALPDCQASGDICVPPREFTERLCKSSFPGVSIAMLEKGSEWARGYIRVEHVAPTNTFGGPVNDAKLAFGEEVVILQKSGGGEGMQVSGSGFVVLRWDGTCATLADHELVPWMPGAPRHAPFVWNYIDTNIQEALLSNKRIGKARKKQKKQCRGGRLGRQSPECQKATNRLNETVVLAVRTGIALPTPENLP